jgi:hypothetical protein
MLRTTASPRLRTNPEPPAPGLLPVKPRPWQGVVLYCEDEDHDGRQYAAVTSPFGPLAGLRVVRGREDECKGRHARAGQGPQPAWAPAAVAA